MNKKVLAIDFGASSGRAVLGTFDGKKVTLEEIHRFSNDPVIVNGTMYWDILRLFFEIKQSLIKSKEYGEIHSLAIDTWGVDFALIDKDGRLLENPVHYRDNRTQGMIKKSEKYIGKSEFYSITGMQFMEINTVFQLLSLKENRPDLLRRADKLLLTPDYLNFLLCGEKKAEMSIASTTQIFDAKTQNWSKEIIDAFGFEPSLFPEVIPSGTVIGTLSDEICRELDIKPVKVVAVCGHDTESALAAVPTEENDFIFLSSGTWSLLGTELDKPVLDEKSCELNVSNETGFDRKTAYLKNITGLWLIQESRRQWKRRGKDFSFAELENMAINAKPFKCFIDPDSPEFSVSGNIPQLICDYCKKTGQPVPENEGQIMRCIYESLALKYHSAVNELQSCTGKTFESMHIIGGGTKDKLLSRLTANACGIKVYSGPVEATAMGNILIQLMASGDIESLKEARMIVKNSEQVLLFEPENTSEWDKAYNRYKEITENA